MKKEKISIWVSENISHDKVKLLFLDNKFFRDFKISLEDTFFDEEHMIILYPEFGEKPKSINTMKNIVKPYPGLFNCWNDIYNKMKEIGIKKIHYLLAVPDFEYTQKIMRVDELIFIGNFEYAQNFSSILEFLPEHLRNKLE